MKGPNIKPIPFKISKSKDSALLIQEDRGPYFYDKLHYHPEFQITAIVKGNGLFYGGNTVTDFSEGEVWMIGQNVPHLLKNSPIYFSDQSPGVYGVSIFFDDGGFGPSFFQLAELKTILPLLEKSEGILRIERQPGLSIHRKIVEMVDLVEEFLIIQFLEILSSLSRSNFVQLNANPQKLGINDQEAGRLGEVLNYTFNHFHQSITIEGIAKIACLSRSQFSHFFKRHTGKTYIQFLNELRIENACIELKNGQDTIEQICYKVGFQNVSNFVRQFKKTKSLTPSAYRHQWKI